MSRRKQIQLTPAEQAEFLSQPHKAALATIDKDGFPHVVAMGYLARDGAIYMTSYGKAQKVMNIRRNPKVGVMIESGETVQQVADIGLIPREMLADRVSVYRKAHLPSPV